MATCRPTVPHRVTVARRKGSSDAALGDLVGFLISKTGERTSVKPLTSYIKLWYFLLMPQTSANDLAERRRIEDELLSLGQELEALAVHDSWIRERIRRLVGPAREAGITVRDIARLTGLSTQTLHTWMLDLMRPIPDIHYGFAGPVPTTVEQAVLRTMGEDPNRDWNPKDLQRVIPDGWPTGTVAEIGGAMENLTRWHMIWDGDVGYRVAPPPGSQRR